MVDERVIDVQQDGSMTLRSGSTAGVLANGFHPGQDLAVVSRSIPTVLGVAQADAAGWVRFDVTLPASWHPGWHQLLLVDLDSGRPLAHTWYRVTVPEDCIAGQGDADVDADGLTDACDADPEDGPDADFDSDGVSNAADTCPTTPNADQADEDDDGVGDACEMDSAAWLDEVRTLADIPDGPPEDQVASVSVADAGVAYGGTVPPSFPPIYEGLGDAQLETSAVCTTTATSTSPVGTYPITCTGAVAPGFTFQYAEGTFSITKRALTVLAPSVTVVQGAEIPDLRPTYEGLAAGDAGPQAEAICSTDATSESGPGSFDVTCSGAADANYEISYVGGVLTIDSRRAVTVSVADASVTYGEDIPAVTPLYAGLFDVEGGPATPATCSTTATSTSPAGTYPITCSGAADPRYDFTYQDGTLTVAKRAATVSAPSLTVVRGDPIPELVPTYTGLVPGQAAPATPATCSTTAESTSEPGPHPVTCTGAEDPNHDLDVIDGVLTITAPPLPVVTVSAPSPSLVFGSTVPALVPTYTGLTGQQQAPATPASCTTTATAGSHVGGYPVTCSGAADPAHAFAYVTGTLTVTPRPLTVTAPNRSFVQGASIPSTFSPSYSGLAPGASAPATPGTCTTSASSSSPPGSYPITCSGVSDPNYAVTYKSGTLTITRRPLEVPRLGGADRVHTAILASQSSFPGADSASAVVLASADNFPDGLAGTALAHAKGAPLLLTGQGALRGDLLDEIQRVLPGGGRIYVLGGIVALSDDVTAALRSAGFDVVRVAGADRFGTAVAIADAIGGARIALVVTGRNFPDALAAGVAAASATGCAACGLRSSR